VTFFRSIGGSFGTAVLGAIFSNLLVTNVLSSLHRSSVPPGLTLNASDPTSIHRLPAPIQVGVIDGIAHTIETVFLIGVPIAFVAFLLSWALPEVALRSSIRTSEPAENLGLPEPRDSLGEARRIVERALSRENGHDFYVGLARRAGLDLDPRTCWLLFRFAEHPDATLEEISSELGLDAQKLADAFDALTEKGMIGRAEGSTGNGLVLTSRGRDAIDKLLAARCSSLSESLEGWDPQSHPEVVTMINELAKSCIDSDGELMLS
jgi:DNA-binding MarR family transcriptional regulator